MAWYTIENIESLDSPSLVIYPERVKKNIELLKTFVDDTDRLRPHVKTNKCPRIINLMITRGIVKFKCATIAEAEMLGQQGAKDVLLAYQPAGPKIQRYCDLQRKFPTTKFACLIDNQQSLSALSRSAVTNNITVRVFIDLNVGMNRTGIAPGQESFQLYRDARQASNIEFIGLHAYDGHLHDEDLATRKQKCDEGFRGVEKLKQQIVSDGNQLPVVVAGGTPTFPVHAKRNDVELSPGTFIFWDNGYRQLLKEQPFELAALVITRVISLPDEGTVCLDLGHKSIASENPLPKRVAFLNGADLQPVGHSEEHMVFSTNKGHAYKVGDALYGVPHHICPTVALYDEAAVCDENRVGEFWQILARKRKISI